MKKIASLIELLDYRLNMIFAIFGNAFLLWEIHVSYGIERWFEKNRTQINEWLNRIGHIDALLSMSILHYNNPEWCFPTINDSYFSFSGLEIGHPLIKEKDCVNNDYTIMGEGKIDIITGSNMAGKSTFLRTLGLNMVLAFSGAPVCAKVFETSLVNILTYFRIHDSLKQNTSSFYAELKRIREILKKANEDPHCFILLDELLRGTNTIDRNKGSVAIIKQLIESRTIGLIATHDLSLAELKNEYPENLRNYNFDVSVKGDELYFDFKLKEGVCKSFNASLLMKKIGIKFT